MVRQGLRRPPERNVAGENGEGVLLVLAVALRCRPIVSGTKGKTRSVAELMQGSRKNGTIEGLAGRDRRGVRPPALAGKEVEREVEDPLVSCDVSRAV